MADTGRAIVGKNKESHERIVSESTMFLTEQCSHYRNGKYQISGRSAVGSALALGACLAVTAVKMRKYRKAFNGAVFQEFKMTQKSVDFEFDHSLSHFHAKRSKIEYISGCGAAGSAGGLGPSGRRFDPCHSDQKGSGINVPEPFLNI